MVVEMALHDISEPKPATSKNFNPFNQVIVARRFTVDLSWKMKMSIWEFSAGCKHSKSAR